MLSLGRRLCLLFVIFASALCMRLNVVVPVIMYIHVYQVLMLYVCFSGLPCCAAPSVILQSFFTTHVIIVTCMNLYFYDYMAPIFFAEFELDKCSCQVSSWCFSLSVILVHFVDWNVLNNFAF